MPYYDYYIKVVNRTLSRMSALTTSAWVFGERFGKMVMHCSPALSAPSSACKRLIHHVISDAKPHSTLCDIIRNDRHYMTSREPWRAHTHEHVVCCLDISTKTLWRWGWKLSRFPMSLMCTNIGGSSSAASTSTCLDQSQHSQHHSQQSMRTEHMRIG